ncbi:SDR family oxidoreductase [Xenorhabdus bovienii]|uniref:type I polyketide synthase n=1 Tax=Xenorhabdus bovienii TaxID=40576 RepID=UPI003DA56CD8
MNIENELTCDDILNDVAIIGMAGRFPEADNIDQFWSNLCEGKESIKFFSEDELLALGVKKQIIKQSNYVPAKGSIENSEFFDAEFFGYTPYEAELLDPQHRLFLETAFHALEDAGYDTLRYNGNIGVFAGAAMNTYLIDLYSNPGDIDPVGGLHLMLSNDKDYLPTRVSYKLNLTGPSVNIQTACSTSLVAVHMACQSVLSGESDIALAGGVSISIPSQTGYLYQEGGFFSPDGHCRAFDEKAQGTTDGNGLGIVVLKRLSSAIEDKDHIYCIIKGSCINNDGSGKIGYTAPSEEGQFTAINTALNISGVNPEDVTYIETHGTGTILGDPIELSALKRAYASKNRISPCLIGSVKTNIGHLGIAAGVAGLIKTSLALNKGIIPSSLNFDKPNPKLKLEEDIFYVNTKLTSWNTICTKEKYAGISAFGIGGTNAHIVLKEYQDHNINSTNNTKNPHLIILSAKRTTDLAVMCQELCHFLEKENSTNLANIAYTYQIGRSQFGSRVSLVCHNKTEAIKRLQELLHSTSATKEINNDKVVFMFPGGGTHYLRIGQELFETLPIFQKTFKQCSDLLSTQLKLDLCSTLYSGDLPSEEIEMLLEKTSISLPLIFSIEYSLACQLMHWGIQPHSMIGHSLGEYVAACISGIFSLEDAIYLVACRSRLLEEISGEGVMLCIMCSTEKTLEYLDGTELSLAVINSPNQTVVSGRPEEIQKLVARLDKNRIAYYKIPIHTAGHSHLVEPVLKSFEEVLQTIKFGLLTIPYVSNVTGTWITQEEAQSKKYWLEHLKNTVNFSAGISKLLKDDYQIFLEVGPGKALTTLIRDHNPISPILAINCMKRAKSNDSDSSILLNAVGKLWETGVTVDWSKFNEENKFSRVSLPRYPFQRKYFSRARKPELPALLNDQLSSSVAIEKSKNINRWLNIPVWKEAILLSQEKNPECVLVFLHKEDSISCQFLSKIQRIAENTIIVYSGAEPYKKAENTFYINPGDHSHYNKLFSELDKQGKTPDVIVNLWLIPNYTFHETVDTVLIDYSFYSILYIAKYLSQYAIGKDISLYYFTSQLATFNIYDIPNALKSLILGPSKSISQEYPNITVQCVDIPTESEDPFYYLDALIKEVFSESENSNFIYRQGKRWKQNYITLPTTDAVKNTSALKHKGVYFITGGLGRVGLILAEYLATHFNAKLVLLTHSDFPPEEEWDCIVSRVESNPKIINCINKLYQFKKLGSEIMVIKADVASKEQMSEAISQTLAKFGKINGVIHGAATVGERAVRSVTELNRNDLELQLHTKIYGTLALANALNDVELDFCILMSSLSAILGGLGYSAYASANAFMDAYSHNKGRPWVSINWDLWDTNDGKVFGKSLSKLPMSPSEGAEVFHRITGLATFSQIAVSTGNLNSRINQWVNREGLQLHDKIDGNNVSYLTTYPQYTSQYVTPANSLETVIVNIWQELFGIDEIGVETDFFEIGGHSLLAVRLVSRVRDVLKIDFPLRQLFKEPTVRAMSEKLEAIGHENGINIHEISDLLIRISSLSEDEVKKEIWEELND